MCKERFMNHTTRNSMPVTIENTLASTFGFNGFREGQRQTIKQLLENQSTLAIFPTGSGKSLCYQLTALHLPHLTLVVSPLLALMKDQLQFLHTKGIAAASIDSTLTPEQNTQIMQDIRNGNTKILMVSVERFKNERFRRFISSIPISLLVIDEAHCISEWGHNFRPDYLKLPQYCQQLNMPLVLLLTATATRKVKQDMANRFNINDSHIVQTGFYRANLDLAVQATPQADKNSILLKHITKQTGSGIVYVTLQQSAMDVAQFLQQQQIKAHPYHAGLNDIKRATVQQQFMNDEIDVVVATIAFGMGVDKANIRYVIHYDLPKSIENYSQEIGRAGRDGQRSHCITLANLDGLNTMENFVYGDTPEKANIARVLASIKEQQHNNEWEMQEYSLSIESNIRLLPLKTLLVQLELMDVLKAKYSYFAEFKVKFITSQANIMAKFNQQRQHFLSQLFSCIAMKKVWGLVDFERLLNQHNIDRNKAVTTLEYLAEHEFIGIETKAMTQVYDVNTNKLTNEQLLNKLHQYFATKESAEIARISALVRFFELERCLSNNLAQYFDDNSVPSKCGHCSACRQHFAKLSYSQQLPWPSDDTIKAAINNLTQHLTNHSALSATLYCRFLAGLTLPLFTRNKVRSVTGFGICAHLRYHEIADKVKTIIN